MKELFTLICLVWIVTPKVLLRNRLLDDRKLQNAYTRFFVLSLCKAKFQLICMEPSQKWYIYMRNQSHETEFAYKSAKCNTLNQCGATDYRPPIFYTQSARRLVCNPQGNNYQNKQNIVVFFPYFPHVKSDLNGCFAGGKKTHNNEETPYHILWCAKKPI